MAVAYDVPCEVQTLLGQYCAGCHQAASSIPLSSRADLMEPSQKDPTLTMAQAVVMRLSATDSSKMPPSPNPAPTSGEVDAFVTWVTADAPVGSCTDDLPPPVPSPYDTPVVCTSASYWTGGNEESPKMNPGQACISCHTEEDEGPELAVAGTLYPSAHEPDDCNGVTGSSATYVQVTDAAGRVFRLQPNSAGNFLLEDPDAFSLPYTAKVVSGSAERVMLAEQLNGDCNECHSESGSESAPGRIMLP